MLELRKAAVLAAGVRGDPVRPLSMKKPPQREEKQEEKVSKPETESPVNQQVPGNLDSAGVESVQMDTGGCPFSSGIPVLVSELEPGSDFVTLPLYPPFQPIQGHDTTGVGHPARATQPDLTDDQRLAASILQEYVRVQEESQKQQSGEQRPKVTARSVPPDGPREAENQDQLTPRFSQGQSSQTAQAQVNYKTPSSSVQHQVQQPTQASPRYVQQPTQMPRHEQQQPLEEQTVFSKDSADLSTGAEGSTGTRMMPPQQNEVGVRRQSSLRSEPSAGNPSAAADGKTSSSSSNSTSGKTGGIQSTKATGDNLTAERTGGYLLPTPEPTSRLDENTVLRELNQLQQKKKVLFTPGSAGGEPAKRGSLSGSVLDGQVDLS